MDSICLRIETNSIDSSGRKNTIDYWLGPHRKKVLRMDGNLGYDKHQNAGSLPSRHKFIEYILNRAGFDQRLILKFC